MLHTGPRRAAEQGLSLVELVVLMGATTVVICSLLAGIVSMNSERQIRDEEMLAFDACRNVLENLRTATGAALAASNGRGFSVAGTNGSGAGLAARADDVDGLPGLVTVQRERVYGTSVLYRVTVAVDWTGAAPHGHFHLTTLMLERR